MLFYPVLCSGVEDILRKKPDTIDWIRPSDGLTSLHMAGVRNQLFVVRHLALSVRQRQYIISGVVSIVSLLMCFSKPMKSMYTLLVSMARSSICSCMSIPSLILLATLMDIHTYYLTFLVIVLYIIHCNSTKPIL